MVENDEERKKRSSKARRPRGLPKSYRWQKTRPEPNQSCNKLKKFNCNLKCTEKLSSLLMCQKGYASFAFYAVFAVFILAFIYVLWKIVSANTSRSGQGRRPEASPKVSPTTSSPTWSEEDEEELNKFFPTSASFLPTNINSEKKTEPTVSPSISPDPNKLIGEIDSPVNEVPTPTPQSPPVGTNSPSLRLLRGSVFGEDTVTPLYGRSHQSVIIGEDFTPLPAVSPFTSRWPPISGTNWNMNQQQQQQPWSSPFNRQQPVPLAYQRRNPQSSLMRNSELPGQYYGRRGQYSLHSGTEGYKGSVKGKIGILKKMPPLLKDGEGRMSKTDDNDLNLHGKQKNHEKTRHHRSHGRRHHQLDSWDDKLQHHRHNKNSDDDKDSRFRYESESADARDVISRPDKNNGDRRKYRNNRKQHNTWLKRHHEKHAASHRRKKIDINYVKDIESVDENNLDNDVETRHHHQQQQHHHHQHHQQQQQQHHHQHHQQQQHHHHHQQQQHHNQHNQQQHPHQHHHHHIQQPSSKKHFHHHHHNLHHHHHTQQQPSSKKHSHHKDNHDQNEEDPGRHYTHKGIHRHSLLQSKDAKKTKNYRHLKKPHHSKIKSTRSHIIKHHKQEETNKSNKHMGTLSKHKVHSTTTMKNPARLKRLHHVLDYKHYVRFKQKHSLDEEVQGKWKGIKQKIKDCIKIKTFTANGKVRLTRTRYHNKYLYTVLVCKVVQVRKRGSKHRLKSKYKTTQLCYKLYFVTKAIVRVSLAKEVAGKSDPEYKVDACRFSKEIHFQAVSFKGALSKEDHRVGGIKSDRLQRSDIPKHHLKGSHHSKKDKAKTHHKHKVNKGKKHNINRKHKTKGKENHPHELTHPKKSKHLRHLSKKPRKLKSKTKKHLSNKHASKKQDKNNKKETRDKSQYEDIFFGKLLNILTVASGSKTSTNTSNPLLKLKGALQKMKKAKEEKARQLKMRHKYNHTKESMNHLKASKLPDVSSPEYIQKLLQKILPSVVSNVKADLQGKKGKQRENVIKGKVLVSTTTTALPTTTPRTTTRPTTTTPSTTTRPTTRPTTKPTTKPKTKTKGLEDELKDILPLLLKKAQLERKTTTTQKPTTMPTTKPTPPSKTKEINELLARLKLGGFDLGSLGGSKPTRDVKTTVNDIHTTVQQKMEALSEPDTRQPIVVPTAPIPHQQPQPRFSLQNNMGYVNEITNRGGPVSVLGNDPFAKNILCFGDSLTNGYYNHGRGFHPYSIQLSRLLNANSQTSYKLITSGRTGEMTHGSMTKRLPEVLGNSSHFDWIILLAGTNDVAHVKNFGDDDSFMNQLVNVWSPKIFKDIITLHESAYRYGARTVLLTIPESAYESWPQFRTLLLMRRKINQELREFASRSQGRTVLCDLALKIPRHSLSPQMQKAFWSDHLHLTPYGYDKMAEVIYQCVKPYL